MRHPTPRLRRWPTSAVATFFFSTDMSGVANHAGIFEGNGMFLHAPHTGDVIKSTSINDPFYMHTFLAGRRISG